MNRVDDPQMCSAAADIALQGLNDLRRSGVGIRSEKADAAQDHPRCAIGTLERSRVEKCLLHRMQMPVFLEAFNGCDGLCRGCANRNLARAARRSAEQDGASAALALTTAVFGTDQA